MHLFTNNLFNAGGAGDGKRYTLPRLLTLAASLMQDGYLPTAGPVSYCDAETTGDETVRMILAVLPPDVEVAEDGTSKDSKISICKGFDADGKPLHHSATVASIRAALSTLVGESGLSVVDGNGRVLAHTLCWAMGLTPPELRTIEVETEEARDISYKGNKGNALAMKIASATRVQYVIDALRKGTAIREADCRKLMGAGVGQLAFAQGVIAHKLDMTAQGVVAAGGTKETLRKVRDLCLENKLEEAIEELGKIPPQAKRVCDAKMMGDLMLSISPTKHPEIASFIRAWLDDDAEAVARICG